MTRNDYLNRLRTHPMIGKDFTRLNKVELEWMVAFVDHNAALTLDEWATKINRLAITDEQIRPHNRTRVWALLLEAVTTEYILNRE